MKTNKHSKGQEMETPPELSQIPEFHFPGIISAEAIVTRAIMIQNSEGGIAAEVSADEDGSGCLQIVGRNGACASIGMTGDNLSINLSDSKGRKCFEVFSNGDGDVLMGFLGAEEKLLLGMGADENGDGFLFTQNKKGERLIHLGKNQEGAGNIAFFDPSKKPETCLDKQPSREAAKTVSKKSTKMTGSASRGKPRPTVKKATGLTKRQ